MAAGTATTTTVGSLAKTGLRWTWTATLAIFSLLVAAYAFAFLSVRPFEASDPFMVRFALLGLPVPMHFFGAGLALLLVPLQASALVRRRWPTLHRIGGGLSIGGILVGGIGGLIMAFDSHRGWVTGLGFGILAVLWLATMALGVRAVVRRDFAAHRRWMLRCMALTAGAITLRVLLFTGFGVMKLPFDTVYIFSAWASWIVNLAIIETWLRWQDRRPLPRLAASAVALRS